MLHPRCCVPGTTSLTLMLVFIYAAPPPVCYRCL